MCDPDDDNDDVTDEYVPDETGNFSDPQGPATPGVADNCQFDVNTNQQNTDEAYETANGLALEGDVCDGDDDADGIPDQVEVNIGTNPLDTDSDGDGIDDGIEVCKSNLPCDLETLVTAENTDGDALIDALDQDSDNDTLLDKDEAVNASVMAPVPVDTDGDGTPNFRDLDSDDDGVLDKDDNCPTVDNPPGPDGEQADGNGDGIGDACQPGDDSDNDGWDEPDATTASTCRTSTRRTATATASATCATRTTTTTP